MSDGDSRPAAAGDSRPISIWRPRSREGRLVWERPAPGPFGDHHAPRIELAPRTGPLPRRVCLLGESAAAGYLYAPHATPARVLEEQLAAVSGPHRWEVIDLARTNETLGPLVATAEAVLQLEPDLLVVFAGNNFNLLETAEVSPYFPSTDGRRRLAAALAQAGPAGAVGLARRTLAGRVGEALDRLAGIARAAAVPLLLVIPEVSLADWASPQPTLWLPGDGVGRWHRLHDEARAALGRADWSGAEAAAWRMNALDGSSSPTAFRLLARAWRGAGREPEARDAALAEVDSVHYPLLACLAAPQATTAARSLLAAAADRHGLARVDLRPLFASHTGSVLPGRRMFLDYCHLTLEGMAVAMAAVAERALRLCPAPGDPPLPWREVLERSGPPRIAPEADAAAWLGAAVHTAHRLLASPPAPGTAAEERPALLAHWCRSALDRSPGVARAMLDLAAARLAPWPAVLTAALERLQDSPYRLGFQHGLRWSGLDGELLRAFGAALATTDRPEAADLERLLEEAGRGPAASPGDLARGDRYLAEPLARFYPEAMDEGDPDRRATLRSPWPYTGFHVVSRGSGPVRLELTARLPPIPGAEGRRRGSAAVLVAGRRVGRVRLDERWRRSLLRVPAGLLGSGVQRIDLAWPAPPPVGEEALDAARRRLERGVDADLHPVFGEVFSLALDRG